MRYSMVLANQNDERVEILSTQMEEPQIRKRKNECEVLSLFSYDSDNFNHSKLP